MNPFAVQLKSVRLSHCLETEFGIQSECMGKQQMCRKLREAAPEVSVMTRFMSSNCSKAF